MKGPQLTYAGVTSTLALFVALGGVGYAAVKLPKNSVGAAQLRPSAVITEKIRDGAVTGQKLGLSSLGTVASSRTAEIAVRVEAVGRVTDTANAGSAETSRTIVPPEPPHRVGAPGEPAFGAGWSNFAANQSPVSFYKDRKGIVHLEGQAQASVGGGSLIFTLPPGYAPSFAQNLTANGGVANLSVRLATIRIETDGSVRLQAGAFFVGLDGLTWRAAD
jgi:hypothetical protein